MGFRNADLTYANARNYWLKFYHVPTGQKVKFKAFVTAFSDDFSSKYNPTSVFGRMDPIQTFQNTSRTISCTFTIAAASRFEARQNLQNINLLTQMLYPKYIDAGVASTISASPLFRVKFANLIYAENSPAEDAATDEEQDYESGLLGAVGGFKISPKFEAGFRDDIYDTLIPMQIPISFNMAVIHEHKLGWEGEREDAKFGRQNIDNMGNRYPYEVQRASEVDSNQAAAGAAIIEAATGAPQAASIIGEAIGGFVYGAVGSLKDSPEEAAATGVEVREKPDEAKPRPAALPG